MKSSITYSYALDSEGKVVSINQIDESNRYNGYKCISCEKPMIPRLGKKKIHHFSHKVSDNCSEETYLHKTSKKLFYERYIHCIKVGQRFDLEYRKSLVCNHYKNQGLHCSKSVITDKLDLTKLFPTIEIEKSDGGFVPDILLSNSKGKKLYVEFAVTHSCEPEKINSGKKILEFKISNENDLDLFNTASIKYSRDNKVIRHNFENKLTEKDLCNGNCNKSFAIFYVYESGKSIILNHSLTDLLEFKKKTIYSAVLYDRSDQDLDYYQDRNYLFIEQLIIAFESRINVKNCYLCRYHAMNNSWSEVEDPIFCKFLKARCKSNDASSCEYYKPDSQVYSQYKNQQMEKHYDDLDDILSFLGYKE